MADAPITLSKALQDYIARTGKTLAKINHAVYIEPFRHSPYVGGVGYLELVHLGRQGHDPLDHEYPDYGPQLLAAFLKAERARLGLGVPSNRVTAPSPPTTPAPREFVQPTRFKRGVRKHRPPTSKNE